MTKKQESPNVEKIVIIKEEAVAAYQGNHSKLADALGIVASNISRWPDFKPIPKGHALALATLLRPELFGDRIPEKYRSGGPE